MMIFLRNCILPASSCRRVKECNDDKDEATRTTNRPFLVQNTSKCETRRVPGAPPLSKSSEVDRPAERKKKRVHFCARDPLIWEFDPVGAEEKGNCWWSSDDLLLLLWSAERAVKEHRVGLLDSNVESLRGLEALEEGNIAARTRAVRTHARTVLHEIAKQKRAKGGSSAINWTKVRIKSIESSVFDLQRAYALAKADEQEVRNMWRHRCDHCPTKSKRRKLCRNTIPGSPSWSRYPAESRINGW
jgi:hypothetical protein